jgi:hypothetical protein
MGKMITRKMSREALMTLYNAAKDNQGVNQEEIEKAKLLLGIRLDTNKIEPYYGPENGYEPWEMGTVVVDFPTRTLWRVEGYTGADNVYCERLDSPEISQVFSPNEISSDLERKSK